MLSCISRMSLVSRDLTVLSALAAMHVRVNTYAYIILTVRNASIYDGSVYNLYIFYVYISLCMHSLHTLKPSMLACQCRFAFEEIVICATTNIPQTKHSLINTHTYTYIYALNSYKLSCHLWLQCLLPWVHSMSPGTPLYLRMYACVCV